MSKARFRKLWTDTDFKKAIVFCVEEMFRALKESFADLSNEELWAFPIEGKLNIATYVMHCLDATATFGVTCHTGKVRLHGQAATGLLGWDRVRVA